MKTLYSFILCFLVFGLSAKDRSRNESTTPTMTEKAISAGFNHTLIIQESNVFAWGENTFGQLGDGTFGPTGIQVPVLNLDHIIAVSAGRRHSMALRADGAVFVWGDNTFGQLGTGGPASPVPVQVSGVSDIIDIQAGDFHCLALKSDGTVISWGANSNGELGQGTITATAGPGNVVDPTGTGNLSGITLISAGARHSLAILDGNVLAWGDNTNAQLGRFPAMANSSLPLYIETGKFFSVRNLNNIISLSAGHTHSMAIDVEGQLWTWGEGVFGQLGIGPVNPSDPATFRRRRAVNVASKVRTMAAGATHSIYVDSQGELHFFGSNFLGQLGIPPTATRVFNDSTVSFNRVAALACGSDFTILLRSDGTIMGSGDNAHEQLGAIPGPPFSAVFTTFFNKVDRIAQIANQANSFVLKSDGTVWSFGDKDYVGFTTSNHVTTATQIPTLSNIIAIGATNNTGMALEVDGNVWVWGKNTSGECGQGTTTSLYTTPTLITGLSDIIYLDGTIQGSLYGSNACAIDVSGDLYAWGNNRKYVLGDGSNTDRLSPVRSTLTSKDFSVSMSDGNTFVLNADNTVELWGSKTSDGSTYTGTVLSTVRSLNTTEKIKTISTTRDLRMALVTNGTIVLWGKSGPNSPNFFRVCGGSSPYDEMEYPSIMNTSPTSFAPIQNVKSIESGDDVGFFICADGDTQGWGENQYGHLGRGYRSTEEYIPSSISCKASGYTTSMYSSISFEHHALANESTTRITSWGNNNYSQTSVPKDKKRPYVLGCSTAMRLAFFEDPQEGINLSIYPNPATTEINIHLGEDVEEDFWYQLMDTSGRSISSGQGTNGQGNLKIDQLEPGIYFLKVQTKDLSDTRRVIIQ